MRSGPPRQRDAIRHGRNGDSGWVALPAGGRRGRTPAWPLGEPTADERKAWKREWQRPQAVQWERLGWEVQVALYVKALLAVSEPNASATRMNNLLRLMDNIGLSDAGMARLRWFLADEAEAAPRAPKRTATTSAKDRIQVIQGGANARAS